MIKNKTKIAVITILVVFIALFSYILKDNFSNNFDKITLSVVQKYKIPKFNLSVLGNYNLNITDDNIQSKFIKKYDFYMNVSSKKVKTTVYGIPIRKILDNENITDYSEIEFVGVNSSVRFSKEELTDVLIVFNYDGNNNLSMINMKKDYSYSIVDLIGLNVY